MKTFSQLQVEATQGPFRISVVDPAVITDEVIVCQVPGAKSNKSVMADVEVIKRLLQFAHAGGIQNFIDTLALARIKWGDLDPDANKVFEKSAESLSILDGGETK
jgi:hypothetical protein